MEIAISRKPGNSPVTMTAVGAWRRLRDTKDLRFGMGIGAARVKSPERRDLGYERCVHSLFRQGCVLYDLILTMPDAALRTLM